jgi:ABC-type transport system substrate-binding protein
LNSLGPGIAPVTSVSYPDNRTISFKLAFPTVSFLRNLAFTLGHIPLTPRESGGQFDPRGLVRGTGPWQVKEYTPSVGITYQRNPNWYDKDTTYYFDGFDNPIISEYSQRLGQFKNGRLWSPGDVNAEDVIPTKREVPSALLIQNDRYRGTDWLMIYGYALSREFLDERVRQAISMLIDRDTNARVFGGVDVFEKDGVDASYRINSHFQSSWDDFWLDPTTNALGEGAKYFKLDPAEAIKLLSAAGYTKDKPLDFPFDLANNNPQSTQNAFFAITEQLNSNSSGALRVKNNIIDYQTQFLPNYNTNGVKRPNGFYHEFKGISPQGVTDWPDIDMTIAAFMRVGGSFYKWEDGTEINFPNDAKLVSMFDAQRGEFDAKKRNEILKDIQKLLAVKQYHTSLLAYGVLGFSLAQPWVGNFNVFSSYENVSPIAGMWYDETKKTS